MQSFALVAQLDRVLPSEGRGRTFESCQARHFSLILFFHGQPTIFLKIFLGSPWKILKNINL